ncbi:hypothetical protein EYF80_060622 [Liparis tanakae]|uniref:Uncharacterized protein n=1 Tax=Liparis tanakae TaxID=230148 RepID=A0A4Z2EKX2_9TELE|nr:hypothetical protein EYF80_060622 [Liparis tanakae]
MDPLQLGPKATSPAPPVKSHQHPMDPLQLGPKATSPVPAPPVKSQHWPRPAVGYPDGGSLCWFSLL